MRAAGLNILSIYCRILSIVILNNQGVKKNSALPPKKYMFNLSLFEWAFTFLTFWGYYMNILLLIDMYNV